MSDQVKEGIREEEREEAKEESRLSTAEVAQALKKPEATRGERNEEMSPLLPSDKAENFRSRWTDIQAGFVDEPRHSVEQADALVAEVMQYLAQTFADERQKLESQWGRGDNVSTEDLRIGLQRYRSFFSRLLSV
jgi:hypothetical protein